MSETLIINHWIDRTTTTKQEWDWFNNEKYNYVLTLSANHIGCFIIWRKTKSNWSKMKFSLILNRNWNELKSIQSKLRIKKRKWKANHWREWKLIINNKSKLSNHSERDFK